MIWQLDNASALEGCFNRYVSSAFANALFRLNGDEGLVEILLDVRTHSMTTGASVDFDRICSLPPLGAGDAPHIAGLIRTNHTSSGTIRHGGTMFLWVAKNSLAGPRYISP